MGYRVNVELILKNLIRLGKTHSHISLRVFHDSADVCPGDSFIDGRMVVRSQLFMDDGGPVKGRFPGIKSRRQFLVFYPDFFGSFLGLDFRLRGHRRHRFSHVANLADREERLVLYHVAKGKGKILSCYDSPHPRYGPGCRGVNFHYFGVGQRASQGGTVEHAREFNVDRIQSLAGYLVQCIHSGNTFPHVLGLHFRNPPPLSRPSERPL